uniref:Uncharacterized protein n=1 Tax=Cucumis melo TaxID=3656 RepID=A0A9I9DIH1_CUCME
MEIFFIFSTVGTWALPPVPAASISITFPPSLSSRISSFGYSSSIYTISAATTANINRLLFFYLSRHYPISILPNRRGKNSSRRTRADYGGQAGENRCSMLIGAMGRKKTEEGGGNAKAKAGKDVSGKREKLQCQKCLPVWIRNQINREKDLHRWVVVLNLKQRLQKRLQLTLMALISPPLMMRKKKLCLMRSNRVPVPRNGYRGRTGLS